MSCLFFPAFISLLFTQVNRKLTGSVLGRDPKPTNSVRKLIRLLKETEDLPEQSTLKRAVNVVIKWIIDIFDGGKYQHAKEIARQGNRIFPFFYWNFPSALFPNLHNFLSDGQIKPVMYSEDCTE